jgi:hypothetical protein
LIEPKDVVIAILGASAGLGGFLLVFLGLIIASYQSYAGDAPEAVVRPFRTAGGILLAAFGLSLVAVVAALAWMVAGGPAATYWLIVAVFLGLLVVVFAAAAWTTRLVLWR